MIVTGTKYVKTNIADCSTYVYISTPPFNLAICYKIQNYYYQVIPEFQIQTTNYSVTFNFSLKYWNFTTGSAFVKISAICSDVGT